MSKRTREYVQDEQHLIDDILQCILSLPLTSFMCDPNNTNALILDVFHIPLVSRQWYRVFTHLMKTLNFSWLDRMSCFNHKVARHRTILSYYKMAHTDIDEQLKIARTSEYYEQCGIKLEGEIKAFMSYHRIVYRTPSGKIYTGHVGMRKLGRIKVRPAELGKRYKAFFTQYNMLHTKRLALYKKMDDWFRRQPILTIRVGGNIDYGVLLIKHV